MHRQHGTVHLYNNQFCFDLYLEYLLSANHIRKCRHSSSVRIQLNLHMN